MQPGRHEALLRCFSSPSLDTLGIEPRAFLMRSGCDTTTPPCALRLAWCEEYICRGAHACFVNLRPRGPCRVARHPKAQQKRHHSEDGARLVAPAGFRPRCGDNEGRYRRSPFTAAGGIPQAFCASSKSNGRLKKGGGSSGARQCNRVFQVMD